MVPLAIPNSSDDKAILVADDEREHVEFLLDYLTAKGFNVNFVESAKEALDASEKIRYRAYFIDLNIPFGNMVVDFPTASIFRDYPGLYIIQAIRSQGNSGSRVIAYSAHYNALITSEIEKLYCRYVVKGRVRELKDAVDLVIGAS